MVEGIVPNAKVRVKSNSARKRNRDEYDMSLRQPVDREVYWTTTESKTPQHPQHPPDAHVLYSPANSANHLSDN